jgi:flagellar export protein FliJ
VRRFRFQLDGLEKLLAHREDQAKLLAARAAAERRRAQGLLGHLCGLAGEGHRERRRRRSEGAVPPHQELVYEGYFARLARAVGQHRQQAAAADQSHAACLEALRRAATRRRTNGLLREHRLAQHRRGMHRELTRTLDEVGGGRHAAAARARQADAQ